MEAVREFHQDGADVVAHGVEHLFEVVELLRHLVVLLLLLGDGADKERHIRTERAAYLLHRVRSVLHHVVQESGDNGVNVEVQLLGGDFRHGEGMENVGFAGFAPLRGMGLAGHLEGLAQTAHVGAACARRHDAHHLFGAVLYLLGIISLVAALFLHLE